MRLTSWLILMVLGCLDQLEGGRGDGELALKEFDEKSGYNNM